MKFALAMFRRRFKSSKCKTMAKLATARIKLLRNKREVLVKQMRRDVALLLQSGQDATARIRVEHVIREQNIMAANEIIELFCELVVVRLPIIAKQRECPADLKEGISSLIFAAPRCSDIPELLRIRNIFEKKYGKEFVSAATELRPDSGVNRTLIDKLSVRTPTGEVKLKLMKEIAKEYQVEWDMAESEMELLKPPEQLLEGPRTFVSAASMPVKPVLSQGVEPDQRTARLSSNGETGIMHFNDMASAAEAAAEAAKKAVAAAQAAACLANIDPTQAPQTAGLDMNLGAIGDQISSNKSGVGPYSGDSNSLFLRNDAHVNIEKKLGHQSELHVRRVYESQSFGKSHYVNNEDGRPANLSSRTVNRRHSYNVPASRSDIKFDDSDGLDSDCDDEMEMETPTDGIHPPPDRPPPPLPSVHANKAIDRTVTNDSASRKRDPITHVHPKLPDYDALAARFEALKFRK